MANQRHRVIANVARLNRYMDQHDLSAVAVRSGVNFTYLAGMAMPGTLMRHLDIASTVRGFMLLWPRDGEPVVVLDSMAEKVVQRDSWIQRVELYQAYVESLYTRVAEVIKEYGLDKRRVGFERDALSASHWQQFQDALPNMKMIDISRIMDEVRWVKTSGEVALQKKLADMLDETYLEVFPTIREGDSEREVHSRITASCLRRGFTFVHGILNSSSNNVMYGGESDVKFRNGDFVRNDYVAYLAGYAGHQSRLAIIGQPNAEQSRGYELTLAVHRKAIDKCRPGVTAGEIYELVVNEFRKCGIEYTATLVGHSMGPWFHQQEPVLRRKSDFVLEEGMILAIEPQRQHWHIQDLVHVQRAGAPELLSDRFPIDQPLVIR
jgi:Xaa-Pro aminopeptidase